ncbi:substrate-binding domain-containing protein [Pusillimonas sp. SM2304]|uniref:substrate-binding domain-containing protein n=1 Tax=Pusillimonas sp. SM2304 TaxID=3073241 RepID=UPI002876510E|nr:substrate-binding domain-containing protein [Pusillimonas sp. SM2304]MDS1140605.1 substrate-binding domain-containing protein [Pusillimonas sp. SM2304]
MTYKFKARLSSEWVLEKPSGTLLSLSEVLRLLAAVDATGHIAGACKACGMSYRHAWGILRNAEKEFEAPLIETSRRQGSKLTTFGQHLIWANRRLDARLMPTLESMASELQEELERLYPESPQRLRLHASHGFAVEGLMQLANGMDMSPLELRYRTAIEALASLDRAECDLAGFQVPVGEFEQAILARYAQWLDPARHCLIHLAVRNTGMFVKPDNPKKITSVADLVHPDVRFVNRQIGSSTRFLVGLMLAQLKVDTARVQGFDSSEFTHMAIAAHIASGMADVGIGVETAAWRCGLAFIPLVKERYFFAVHRDTLETPNMQRLLDLMNGDQYQAYVTQLVGYDARHMGQVQTLEEAFGADFAASLKA